MRTTHIDKSIPYKHIEPHISSITMFAVRNQLTRLKAARSFNIAFNGPHALLYSPMMLLCDPGIRQKRLQRRPANSTRPDRGHLHLSEPGPKHRQRRTHKQYR